MLYIKKNLSKIVSEAAAKAFPVSNDAVIKSCDTKIDYITNIASEIFYKNQKNNIAFGLFNPREIADGIFVNCSKQSYIRQVQISGTGDLEIFINDNYLMQMANEIITNKSILFEKHSKDHQIEYIINYHYDIKGYELNFIKELFLTETLKKLNKLQRRKSSISVFFNDYVYKYLSESEGKPLLSNLNDFRTEDTRYFANLKDILMILKEIQIDARLILASDLYNNQFIHRYSDTECMQINVKDEISKICDNPSLLIHNLA